MNFSIARIGYAMITAANTEGYTYGDVKYLESDEAGGRNISASPKGESYEIYADGKAVYGGEINSGYDITAELLDIIDDVEEDWLGNTKLTNGVREKANNGEYPRFALIVAKERFAGTTEYEVDVYYNCQASARPERTAKTSEGSFDPDFPTYNIAARPRISDKLIRDTLYVDELPTAIPTTAAQSGSGSGTGGN